MNIRRTVLRDLDGIVHMIPHGEVLTASNYTKDFSRVNLNVQVAYKEDLDHVIRVLNRVASELAWDEYFGAFIIEPPRVLGVDSFDDSGITIKVVGATKPRRQWDVTRELRRRIKRAFDSEGIEIPFPHRTLFWGTANGQPMLAPPPIALADSPSEPREKPTADRVPIGATKEEWHLMSAMPLVDNGGTEVPHLLSQRQRVQALLTDPPTGLFVDLDGTLIPMAPSASKPILSAPARHALSILASKLHVIVVSGRDIETMRSIVGLNSVTYAGNHGMQWWEKGKAWYEPAAERYVRSSREVFRVVRRRLIAQPELEVELRGVLISISDRAAIDQQAAKDRLENLLRDLARPGQWKLVRRPGAIELVPDILPGRTSMVHSIIERYGLKSAIAFGDDTSDVETFTAIQESEATSQTSTITVAVGKDSPENLLISSDCYLRDPEEAELFLSWLARTIS
jgi:trehalose-phosphatase